MKRILVNFLLIFVFLLLFLPVKGFSASDKSNYQTSKALLAGDSVIVDAKKQYELAQTLFEEKEFSAAAHEYIRFYHLFPAHKKVARAKYQTGLSFYYAGQLKDALRHLEKIAGLGDFSDSGFAAQSMFKLHEVYLVMDDTVRAASVLRNLITLDVNPDVHDRACFMLGWLLFERADAFKSSKYFKVYPIKEAQRYFSMISPQGQARYRIENTMASVAKVHQIKKKNPKLAGLLSIIPGAGFLYCNRRQDALVSFLLNSTLILAAYKSFEDDNAFLGTAISFVEAGFYSGNIYGSMASAHKYNKKQQKDFIDDLVREYGTNQKIKDNQSFFQPRILDNGFALMFKYDF
jgi:tetratricopeptide (TPR) repeat protein